MLVFIASMKIFKSSHRSADSLCAINIVTQKSKADEQRKRQRMTLCSFEQHDRNDHIIIISIILL